MNINRGRSGVEKESRLVRLRNFSFNPFRRIRFSGRKQNPKHSHAVGKNRNVLASVVETAKENLGKSQTMNIASEAGDSPGARGTQLAFPCRRELQLSEVYIHSDMLLQHPFSRWTLLTLNTASSTITKLSFKLIKEAKSTWKIGRAHV